MNKQKVLAIAIASGVSLTATPAFAQDASTAPNSSDSFVENDQDDNNLPDVPWDDQEDTNTSPTDTNLTEEQKKEREKAAQERARILSSLDYNTGVFDSSKYNVTRDIGENNVPNKVTSSSPSGFNISLEKDYYGNLSFNDFSRTSAWNYPYTHYSQPGLHYLEAGKTFIQNYDKSMFGVPGQRMVDKLNAEYLDNPDNWLPVNDHYEVHISKETGEMVSVFELYDEDTNNKYTGKHADKILESLFLGKDGKPLPHSMTGFNMSPNAWALQNKEVEFKYIPYFIDRNIEKNSQEPEDSIKNRFHENGHLTPEGKEKFSKGENITIDDLDTATVSTKDPYVIRLGDDSNVQIGIMKPLEDGRWAMVVDPTAVPIQYFCATFAFRVPNLHVTSGETMYDDSYTTPGQDVIVNINQEGKTTKRTTYSIDPESLPDPIDGVEWKADVDPKTGKLTVTPPPGAKTGVYNINVKGYTPDYMTLYNPITKQNTVREERTFDVPARIHIPFDGSNVKVDNDGDVVIDGNKDGDITNISDSVSVKIEDNEDGSQTLIFLDKDGNVITSTIINKKDDTPVDTPDTDTPGEPDQPGEPKEPKEPKQPKITTQDNGDGTHTITFIDGDGNTIDTITLRNGENGKAGKDGANGEDKKDDKYAIDKPLEDKVPEDKKIVGFDKNKNPIYKKDQQKKLEKKPEQKKPEQKNDTPVVIENAPGDGQDDSFIHRMLPFLQKNDNNDVIVPVIPQQSTESGSKVAIPNKGTVVHTGGQVDDSLWETVRGLLR